MHIGGIPSGSVIETSSLSGNELVERTTSEKAAALRNSAHITELQKQDSFIRKHAESRSLATGAPAIYQTILGPDGNRYVVSGSVDLHVSATSGDPRKTLRDAGYVRRVVENGPILSPEDRAVAVEARRLEWEAQRELAKAETVRQGLYAADGRLYNGASGSGGFILTG